MVCMQDLIQTSCCRRLLHLVRIEASEVLILPKWSVSMQIHTACYRYLSKRYHVGLTSPTRSSQTAGVSIPNAPIIFRIWRSPRCQRCGRCDSPLQLRAAADRDSTPGKGQKIRARGPGSIGAYQRRSRSCETRVRLPPHLPCCIAPSVSRVFVLLVTFVPHTL